VSFVIVLGLVGYVVAAHQLMAMRYRLSSTVANAVGPADTALLAKVHYDPKQAAFVLSAVKAPATSNPSVDNDPSRVWSWSDPQFLTGIRSLSSGSIHQSVLSTCQT